MEVLVDILSQLKLKRQMMRAKAELLSPSLASNKLDQNIPP